jgi:hypothetical protein
VVVVVGVVVVVVVVVVVGVVLVVVLVVVVIVVVLLVVATVVVLDVVEVLEVEVVAGAVVTSTVVFVIAFTVDVTGAAASGVTASAGLVGLKVSSAPSFSPSGDAFLCASSDSVGSFVGFLVLISVDFPPLPPVLFFFDLVGDAVAFDRTRSPVKIVRS